MNFASIKEITIPEGKVSKITRKSDGALIWKKPIAYTNLFDKTANGFKQDYRINSSGDEFANTGWILTNYIPIRLGQKLHIKGFYMPFVSYSSIHMRLQTYKEDFSRTTSDNSFIEVPREEGKWSFETSDYDDLVLVWNKCGYLSDTEVAGVFQTAHNAVYMRISARLLGSVDDVIVTYDENIE